MKKIAGPKKLNFTETSALSKTRFTEFLIQKNGWDMSAFGGWVFCPGMLFDSLDTWWGNRRMRDRPHEGLDLCLYRDREDRILHLDEKTKIPVMYDGVVVRVMSDFLGKSVIVEHKLQDNDKSKFCTIYGHIIPHSSLSLGKVVKEGEIIANLADANKSKTLILPHLHISLAWPSNVISYNKLTWDEIGARTSLTLVDPLHILDSHHLDLERDNPPCRNL
jgi:hypothetical protein